MSQMYAAKRKDGTEIRLYEDPARDRYVITVGTEMRRQEVCIAYELCDAYREYNRALR